MVADMRKLLIIMLLLAALSGVAFASPESQTDLCLLRLTPYVDIVNDAGLYPSVMLAQEILETAHCRSEAANYNNFWGIKCQGGLCFSKQTWEIYEKRRWDGPLPFQVFDSPREAVEAYCRKILWQEEYQDVDYDSLDVYIDSLASVWATDPGYAGKIKDIVERYDLERFDRRE